MTYEEALAQLKNHASLAQSEDEASLLYQLWKADRDGALPDLSPYVENVLACLAVANLELNGDRPSESRDRPNAMVVSDLVYPVSGLIVGLLRRHRQWSDSGRSPSAALDGLRDAALRIGMAWDMVLAGDHDDLVAELAIEWELAIAGTGS